MTANLSKYATTNHDLSGSNKPIPRTGNIRDREMVKLQAEQALEKIKFDKNLKKLGVTEALSLDSQNHDMSIWIENGVVHDRKLLFNNSEMNFKVRVMNKDGKYFDETINKILSFNQAELDNYLAHPESYKDDPTTFIHNGDDPPMFVLSISDGDKTSEIYKKRADEGRAFAHLVFDNSSKTLEIMHSHGPVDGAEAKAMAFAVGKVVGTKNEEIKKGYFIYPAKDKKSEAVDELGLTDIVSFRKLDFDKIKPHIKTINDYFQEPLKKALKEILKSDGMKFNDEQINILINLLTPPFGISHLVSFLSESEFGGKSTICVQPINSEYRLSLALAPNVASMVKKLIDPNFLPEKNRGLIDEIKMKLLEATKQTNFYANLGLGHISKLYLAAQNHRSFARVGASALAPDLGNATDIYSQISSLGANTDKKFEGVYLHSFVSALSGEKHLSTSIGLEGNTISFRNKLTPELFDNLMIGFKIEDINTPTSINIVEQLLLEFNKNIKKPREPAKNVYNFQMSLFRRFNDLISKTKNGKIKPSKVLKDHLDKVKKNHPNEYQRELFFIKAITIIALENKIDGFTGNLEILAKNISGSLAQEVTNTTLLMSSEVKHPLHV